MSNYMRGLPAGMHKAPIITFANLEQLWAAALNTGDAQMYVNEGIEGFMATLRALQEGGLLSSDGTEGSWLTRGLEGSLTDWREGHTYTVAYVKELGMDPEKIKQLTEDINIDELIRDNKRKIQKILG